MHQNDPSVSLMPSYRRLVNVKEHGEETRVQKNDTSTEQCAAISGEAGINNGISKFISESMGCLLELELTTNKLIIDLKSIPVYKSIITYILALNFISKIWISIVMFLSFISVFEFFPQRKIDNSMLIECQNLNCAELSGMNPKQKKSLELIRELVEKQGFPKKNIYITSQTSRITFTGFNHYIGIEYDLFENGTDDEILGVTAHELGHYINSDVIHRFLYFIIRGNLFPLFVPFIFPTIQPTGCLSVIIHAIKCIYLPLIGNAVACLFLHPLFVICCRFQEYKADTNTVHLGHGHKFCDYLKKFADDNPTSDKFTQRFKFLTDMHPPSHERQLRLLESIENPVPKKKGAKINMPLFLGCHLYSYMNGTCHTITDGFLKNSTIIKCLFMYLIFKPLIQILKPLNYCFL